MVYGFSMGSRRGEAFSMPNVHLWTEDETSFPSFEKVLVSILKTKTQRAFILWF